MYNPHFWHELQNENFFKNLLFLPLCINPQLNFFMYKHEALGAVNVKLLTFSMSNFWRFWCKCPFILVHMLVFLMLLSCVMNHFWNTYVCQCPKKLDKKCLKTQKNIPVSHKNHGTTKSSFFTLVSLLWRAFKKEPFIWSACGSL